MVCLSSHFITDGPDSINLIKAFMTKPREYKMRRSFDNNNKEILEALFQFQISFRKTYEKDWKD